MPFTRATTSIAVLGVALVTPSVPALADPIVWNGPSITVTKPDFADWTLPANQDRLTNDVSLTRRNTRPLFNILMEEGPDTPESPFDTEWAFGPTQPGNPDPTTASNYANLVFAAFVPALGSAVGINAVPYGTGVLHLISNDIYLDIKFTSRTQETGGGFSYTSARRPSRRPYQSPHRQRCSLWALLPGSAWWRV